jgi:predicted membrane-bound spermidine synthase
MSDTPAEWRDHREFVWRLEDPRVRRVLINGLGIGMVIKAALHMPHIENVDVVERDERVIKLVAPHYADPRLTVHHDDALTARWAPAVRWDAIWNDIWPSISPDNLPDMARLHKRYARRANWIGSWCRETCRWMREQERKQQAQYDMYAAILHDR